MSRKGIDPDDRLTTRFQPGALHPQLQRGAGGSAVSAGGSNHPMGDIGNNFMAMRPTEERVANIAA